MSKCLREQLEKWVKELDAEIKGFEGSDAVEGEYRPLRNKIKRILRTCK